MAYRIRGLEPGQFEPLFGLPDEDLAGRWVVRVTVNERPGYPCRVTLDDARPGETVLLLNHVSHEVANPYRAAHAIFVLEGATEAVEFVDEVPPVFRGRLLSLRAFDAGGMMVDAALAGAGEADAIIRRLFESPPTAYIHAHNAARGCFAAAVERA